MTDGSVGVTARGVCSTKRMAGFVDDPTDAWAPLWSAAVDMPLVAASLRESSAPRVTESELELRDPPSEAAAAPASPVVLVLPACESAAVVAASELSPPSAGAPVGCAASPAACAVSHRRMAVVVALPNVANSDMA